MKDRIYISKNSSNTIASGGSVVIDGITLSLSNINEYDVRTIAEEVEVPVKGVKVAGTELTPDSNGKVDIVYSGENIAGVIKASNWFGTKTANGALQAVTKDYTTYTGATGEIIVGKGTLENVLDNETVRADKAQTLTSTQQTQGQSNLGINTEQFVFTMADGTEVTKNIKVSA